MKCSVCGNELNALNMSDIDDDKCQGCVNQIIESLEPIPEEPTLKHYSEIELGILSRMKYPSPQCSSPM